MEFLMSPNPFFRKKVSKDLYKSPFSNRNKNVSSAPLKIYILCLIARVKQFDKIALIICELFSFCTQERATERGRENREGFSYSRAKEKAKKR